VALSVCPAHRLCALRSVKLEFFAVDFQPRYGVHLQGFSIGFGQIWFLGFALIQFSMFSRPISWLRIDAYLFPPARNSIYRCKIKHNMKKTTFLLAAILCSTLSFGQFIGVKGGLNISNLSISDGDVDNRFAYHFGGYFNLPVGELLSIQPEVLYSARGASSTYDADVLGFDIEGESTFKLNYIDVPILAVIHLGDALQIEAGPYVGFLANSSFETEGDLGDFDSDIDNDSFKNLDYGLTGGLAVNLGALQVGARYMHGLQEIQDSDGAELFLGDAKNRVIQVYGALRIGDYD